MWKIRIVYNDGSKATLTGKHKDIPLRLALKYHNEYAAGQVLRKCTYQQYPKKDHDEMDLWEKIEELEMEQEEADKDESVGYGDESGLSSAT
ncbi:MAG: hypothetical protein ACRDBO_14430 [Lachnospiraceae bacterium]